MVNANQLYQSALDAHRNGLLDQAEKQYRQLLASQPRHADALHLLGVLCHQTARHTEAVNLISQAIALNPRSADFLNNHGLALRSAGRLDDAVISYQRALQLAPADFDLHNNLGNVYQELGRFEHAAGCYRRVLHAFPKDIDVRNALCHALQALGNQGHEAGQYVQAEAAYQELIQLSVNNASLYYNLGNAQRELGKSTEAAASYKRALQLAPDDADIHNNLGNVLRELGRLDEAIASYEAALRLNPALYHAKVHLVHQKQHTCDWQGLDADIEDIRHWVAEVPQAQISPFAFLAMPGTTAAEQRRCAEHWVENRYQPLIKQGQRLALPHARQARKKLRIGYLSGDFRLHPLAFLVTELIELHNRSQFETFAYSYSVDDKTPERRRLEKAFDHFVDIRSLALTDAAKKIHTDQIDILVDLTGYTQSTRSGILALRPAPIQVNWLGYPGTMGAPFFDYLLSDGFITPLDQAMHYTEKLALLPYSYQPNDRKRPLAATPTRADAGLPAQGFVFCCFNQSFKITPQIFEIWMRLLQAVPGSVLWLLQCNRWAEQNLRREAAARGMDASRLIFAPRVPLAEHLARHVLADLFLDTLPYNAHTTASDALWMGLPLLTCTGNTFAARVAGSLLHAAHLPELVTESLEHYEALAVQLATQPHSLQALREQLQQTREALPLFDTACFARSLEQAYLRMWQGWQPGNPPQSFILAP
ncbi:MAG: tetratricopeptide repeat protein [Methylophilaceae bacterium]